MKNVFLIFNVIFLVFFVTYMITADESNKKGTSIFENNEIDKKSKSFIKLINLNSNCPFRPYAFSFLPLRYSMLDIRYFL